MTEFPSPPVEKGKSKTPTSTLHSKRPSKERAETPIVGKTKQDQSPASPGSRKMEEKSQQDTSVKSKLAEKQERTPDRFDEYAVKLGGEQAFTQKGETAEVKRIGSNEDIQGIDGENHPLFDELTQE